MTVINTHGAAQYPFYLADFTLKKDVKYCIDCGEVSNYQ